MNKTLDKLYRSRFWTKRGPGDVIAENHQKVAAEISIQVKEKIKFETHHYGKGQSEKLDIFWGPEGPANTKPIFVYFSGGFWQAGCGDNSAYAVSPLHHEGMNCVIVDYPRAPGIKVSEIHSLTIDAMKWTLQNVALPKQRPIFLAGHSVGAQICAMILSSKWFGGLDASEKSLFKGVFYLSGIFYLPELLLTSINDKLKMDQEEAEEMSPMLHLEEFDKNLKDLKENFEVAVIIAEDECPKFIEQGNEYSEKLLKMGFKKTTLVNAKNKDHFDLVEQLSCQDYEITKLIIDVMKNGNKD